MRVVAAISLVGAGYLLGGDHPTIGHAFVAIAAITIGIAVIAVRP